MISQCNTIEQHSITRKVKKKKICFSFVSLYSSELELSPCISDKSWKDTSILMKKYINSIIRYCYDICLILWVAKSTTCCSVVTFSGSFPDQQVVWPSAMRLSRSAEQVVQPSACYACKLGENRTPNWWEEQGTPELFKILKWHGI